ncbi:MAG: VOC family protein [Cyanobacteriota/Melainabacteria group bacterium]
MVLMELGEYPFSQRFSWLNDKFGVSWQVNLASRHQKITPS